MGGTRPSDNRMQPRVLLAWNIRVFRGDFGNQGIAKSTGGLTSTSPEQEDTDRNLPRGVSFGSSLHIIFPSKGLSRC